MSRRISPVLPALALALLPALLFAGCGRETRPASTPTVKPPLIAEPGILRVGVDAHYPPFGAKVDGKTVGIDIDVAGALGEDLGLKVRLVDVGPDGPTAIKEGRVDVSLGALPITEAVLRDVAFAGGYLTDAPAYFSKDPSATAANAVWNRMAVQQGSAAFWALSDIYGEDALLTYPKLKEALTAVRDGHAEVAAGSAVVGAYILRDMKGLHYNGQASSGIPLGVAVSKEAPELEAKVRESLDRLATEDVLDTIRRKWVCDLPEIEVELDRP